MKPASSDFISPSSSPETLMSSLSPGRLPEFRALSPYLTKVLFSSVRGIISPMVPTATRSRTSARTDFGRSDFILRAWLSLKATPQPQSPSNGYLLPGFLGSIKRHLAILSVILWWSVTNIFIPSSSAYLASSSDTAPQSTVMMRPKPLSWMAFMASMLRP